MTDFAPYKQLVATPDKSAMVSQKNAKGHLNRQLLGGKATKITVYSWVSL
jgi:hypothetical protein